MSKLLFDLRDELKVSNILLTKLAATNKFEDGSRKPTKKRKRKKRKLTPAQKKQQKLENKLKKKVKDRLKDRKYKSIQTGDELAFNTAYNRKHPKAVKDFNKAMDQARGTDSSSGNSEGGVNYSQKATFNEDQVDIIKKLLDSGDQLEFNNLPLIVEKSLKAALSAALEAHEAIDLEDQEEDQDEAQTETKSKKPRKTRSDKGKARGPRIKVELERRLPQEDQKQVDIQKLSEVPKEDVSQTKEVLDTREIEREEQSGETEEGKKKRSPRSDKGKSRKKKPSPGQPLTEQPTSVQKEVLKDMLKGALTESLKDLPKTQRASRTVLKEMSDTVDAIEDMGEDQIESMMSAYSSFSDDVGELIKNQGMGELASAISDEMKSVKKPAKLSEGASSQERKKHAEAMGKYLAVMNAKKGIVDNPLFGVRDVPDDEDEEEHLALVRRAQADRFNQMDKSGRNNMVKEISKRKKEIEKKLKDDPENKELISDLKNLNASEQSLNTVRMINKEGVIEGYNEVPDAMLEMARQTKENAWNEAITSLSGQDFKPSDVRDQMTNVLSDLNDSDFSLAIGGSEGPYGGILSTIKDDFCPESPANGSAGGKTLDSGETCPNPMPPHIKNMLRNYMSDSFVNNYTVIEKSDKSTTKKEKKQKSTEHKRNMRDFWVNSRENFLKAFVDGVDKDDNPLSEEAKEDIAEQFRLEWMRAELKDVELYDGIKTDRYKFHELQKKLKELNSLDPVARREKAKEYREQLMKLFDDGHTKQGNIFNSSFINDCYNSGGTLTMQKKSTQYVDYQRRSQAFELGMRVYPFFGGNPSRSGIIIAIYPAIGMVDVQFPHGSQRYPVEDLVVDTSGDYKNLTNEGESIPGGLGVVPVSSPPFFTHEEDETKQASKRVASTYVKNAIYWYKKDRTYRQCKDEIDPCCPKCKTPLGKTVYKRRGGKSERLLACYTCLFIIKPEDIVRG